VSVVTRSCAALAAAISCALPLSSLAQTPAPAPRAIAALRTATAPIIDGQLSDECWAQADSASDFIQRDPDEGRPATERTEVRILYDNEPLYTSTRLGLRRDRRCHGSPHKGTHVIGFVP
jgi:hypothetical protein